MSRVYFHTPTDEAELYGPERGHCDFLVRNLAWGLLDLGRSFRGKEEIEAYWQLASSDRYTLRDEVQACHLYFTSSMDNRTFRIGEHSEDPWHLSLNTAVAFGGDELRLAARLHAQCEIHGYIEGPNRNWYADIIERGRTKSIFREDLGWESVVELLRSRDDEPVVTSYSVCDGFPNAGVVKEAGLWSPGPEHEGHYTAEQEAESRKYHEERQERDRAEGRHSWSDWPYSGPFMGDYWWGGDEWYDLSPKAQWELGMRALREHGHRSLEWSPANWNGDNFNGFGNNHNLNVFHLRNAINDLAQEMYDAKRDT